MANTQAEQHLFDEDLEAIILGKLSDAKKYYELDYVGFNSGSSLIATATLRLKKDDGTILTDSSTGEGPVDAAFKAVERISGCDGKGYSTDVLIASVEAYINALNNYISRIEK